MMCSLMSRHSLPPAMNTLRSSCQQQPTMALVGVIGGRAALTSVSQMHLLKYLRAHEVTANRLQYVCPLNIQQTQTPYLIFRLPQPNTFQVHQNKGCSMSYYILTSHRLKRKASVQLAFCRVRFFLSVGKQWSHCRGLTGPLLSQSQSSPDSEEQKFC